MRTQDLYTIHSGLSKTIVVTQLEVGFDHG